MLDKMKKIIILVILLFIAFPQCSIADDQGLQELSGTFHKSIRFLSPYHLELDGSTGKFSLRGEILENFQEGDRIYVKGYIVTKLYNPEPDGTPQQISVHWYWYMDVIEAKKISIPFGLKE